MAGLVLAIHAFLRVSPSRGYPGHLAKPTSRCPRMTAFGLGSRASRDFRFNCQTATTLQTCVITPVVSGAGAPSCFAFPPLVRGRAERQVPVAPLGLMRCGLPQVSVHQDFRNHEQVPDVPPAVFFRLACTLPRRTIRSQIKVPRRWEGSLKHLGRTRFDLVVRHTVQGSFHLKVGRLLASGSAGADPSCPKTDVPHEPRNAASPASTAPCPANVTIAIAPLGGAGRKGI
jgi:hypothetical protein